MTPAIDAGLGGINIADVNAKELSARMSKRLANFKRSDSVIAGLAEKVLIKGPTVFRFDPCICGICIDYFTVRMPRLDKLTPKNGIRKWEVFPYGIIDWDRFHVQMAYNVDELEGRGLTREFDR